MGKFDDLVFKIPKEFHSWYGFASPRGFFRGTTMMDKAKVYMDYTSITKPLVMEVPHIHHAVDEYIVLANADFNNFYDGFDAEIDFWLGDDPENMEQFTFTEPVIVRVPPKLYHCPINFRRIGKHVLFMAIYLDGDWSKISPFINAEGREDFRYDGAGIRRCVNDRTKECIYCGACFSEKMKERAEQDQDKNPLDILVPFYEMGKRPRTGKFDKYVHYYKPEYHDDPRFLSPRTGFRGREVMPESRMYTLNNIVQQACEIGTTHMHHNAEEYYFFTGADITNFFDFDAEVEISIGETPDKMETYTITEPTAVRIPEGYWHGPVKFKRVGAPVQFMPLYPSGNYGKIIQEMKENGEVVYTYKGTDLPK